MSAPFADVTQTQTRLSPDTVALPPEMPPPPPLEAIIESRLAAAAKMRRPAATPTTDAFTSRFAPWAAQSRGTNPEEPADHAAFVVSLAEAKVESLRQTLDALTGRTKTPGRESGDLARLLGPVDENDPLFGAARVRRTASSSLTFGQRAMRKAPGSREAAACVLRLPTTDPNRALELRISLKHRPAQSGKTGSFLEIAGTLSSHSDVQLVDKLHQRLTRTWGRATV